jgi:pseudaminic acid synthase
LSDHTFGISVPSAAVALGAKIIEKHFIIDRALGGPDSSFSLNVDEFTQMVKTVRDVEKALGTISYELSDKVQKSKVFSRSLFVVKDIKQGETLNEDNVRSIRPGYGIPPKYYKNIIGKKAISDLEKGTPLQWNMFE